MKLIETSKQANEALKKINHDFPVSIFQVDIGMNRPNYFTVFWGRNPPDLYAHQGNSWENFGSELKKKDWC